MEAGASAMAEQAARADSAPEWREVQRGSVRLPPAAMPAAYGVTPVAARRVFSRASAVMMGESGGGRCAT